MLRRAHAVGKSLFLDESGQTMLEYIVIVVFVVIAAMVAFRVISDIVRRKVGDIESSFNQA